MLSMNPNTLSRIQDDYDNPDIYLVKKELDSLVEKYKLSKFYIVYDLYHMHLVSARYYKQGIICKLFNVKNEHIEQFSNILIERIIEICLSTFLIIEYSKDDGIIKFAYEMVDYLNEVLDYDIEFNEIDESVSILAEYFIKVKDMIFLILGNTIEPYANYNDLDNLNREDILSIINVGTFIIKNINVDLEGTLSRLILEMYHKVNYDTNEF